MGFAIPTNDPNAAQQSTPPNVIRASTMESFVLQDRFTLATSRRLVASIGKTTASSTVLSLKYEGQFNTSAYQGTQTFWFAASGTNITLLATLNGVSTTLTMAAGGTNVDANLVYCATTSSAWFDFTVQVATVGAGSGLLNGLYIVEERLASLP